MWSTSDDQSLWRRCYPHLLFEFLFHFCGTLGLGCFRRIWITKESLLASFSFCFWELLDLLFGRLLHRPLFRLDPSRISDGARRKARRVLAFLAVMLWWGEKEFLKGRRSKVIELNCREDSVIVKDWQWTSQATYQKIVLGINGVNKKWVRWSVQGWFSPFWDVLLCQTHPD